MENKRNFMLHAKQNTPLDAYDLYELEHIPWTIRNAVTYSETRTISAKSHAVPDGEVVEPGTGNGKKGRYNFQNTPKDDGVHICGKSIDAEAEKFIEFEHDKFELSKWRSID